MISPDAAAWATFFSAPTSPGHVRFFATDEEIAADRRPGEADTAPALVRLAMRLLVVEPLSRA